MTTLRTPEITGLASALTSSPDTSRFRSLGRVTKIIGLTIESFGPVASIGDLVSIRSALKGVERRAEVVGFRDDRLLLFPLESIDGIRNGDEVVLVNEGFTVAVGDALLGRVLNGLGNPIDDGPPVDGERRWKVRRQAPNSMSRRRITEPLYTGVNSVDAAMTCGRGQRIGIFAGSGVGKSSLLGMISRNSLASVNVIALIGERGKEVLDFIEDSLGEEGLSKSVVVVSTSDKSPLERIKGAETAMAIAEYFRDQGNDVLFVMDSVTRYAMAQREIGLAIGEPPATKGYPPSVFSLLPELLERAGTNQFGSITGFFTVLVEGDDMNDPIADTTRSILDGHVVLSRALASRGHYPAIDVLSSVSRVMPSVVEPEHMKLARELRKLMATYDRVEDMINIGAYEKGGNPEIDQAIERKPFIDRFLIQDLLDKPTWEETYQQLAEAVG